MNSYTQYRLETKVIKYLSDDFRDASLVTIRPLCISFVEDSVTLSGFKDNYKKMNITKVWLSHHFQKRSSWEILTIPSLRKEKRNWKVFSE